MCSVFWTLLTPTYSEDGTQKLVLIKIDLKGSVIINSSKTRNIDNEKPAKQNYSQ